MSEYHKIQTVWLRDPERNHKFLIEGAWAKPEFEYLSSLDWVWTEKVDGTNIRLVRAGCEVRGKADAAQIHPGLLAACQQVTADPAFLDLADEMVLYGEGCGEKIQKGGGNYCTGQTFVLFDVWCGMWLERGAVADIARKLGLVVVPEVGHGPLDMMIDMVRSGGLKSEWGDFPAEGIVARPAVELTNRRGERVITKLKRKDFLHQ